jgi:transcriptional regulator with XRE-family HTH domain
MTVKDSVAAEVRANLARQRISARRAAICIGWTPMYLSRRLSGEVPFDVDDLGAIAELLDIPIATFFDSPNVVRLGSGSRNLRFSTPAKAAA